MSATRDTMTKWAKLNMSPKMWPKVSDENSRTYEMLMDSCEKNMHLSNSEFAGFDMCLRYAMKDIQLSEGK